MTTQEDQVGFMVVGAEGLGVLPDFYAQYPELQQRSTVVLQGLSHSIIRASEAQGGAARRAVGAVGTRGGYVLPRACCPSGGI